MIRQPWDETTALSIAAHLRMLASPVYPHLKQRKSLFQEYMERAALRRAAMEIEREMDRRSKTQPARGA